MIGAYSGAGNGLDPLQLAALPGLFGTLNSQTTHSWRVAGG